MREGRGGGEGERLLAPCQLTATKGAARKSFGSFQRSSRPPVEKERRRRGKGQKRRGTMEGSAAVQATNYKSIVTLIFSPGVLPALSARGTKNETGKERGPFSVPPGSRRNAAIVSPLSRHCRTIKREDKADPQRSCLA